jgi:hypothetical protein
VVAFAAMCLEDSDNITRIVVGVALCIGVTTAILYGAVIMEFLPKKQANLG